MIKHINGKWLKFDFHNHTPASEEFGLLRMGREYKVEKAYKFISENLLEKI